MFKNYLLTAWRALVKQKLHSALNIIGLSVGIAASILMWLFAQDELSYDAFQPNVSNSYRIAQNYLEYDVGAEGIAVTPAKLRSVLENQFSDEVEAVTHLGGDSSNMRLYKDNEKLTGFSLMSATANIKQFFNIPTVFGADSDALTKPDQLLLSRSLALRIFGNENVVGQTLKLNNQSVLTIAGIFEDIPGNSHLNIDALYSMATQRQYSPALFSHLNSNSAFTYVQLKEGVSPNEIASKLGQLMTEGRNTKIEAFLQPLGDIHLHSNFLAEMKTNGSYQTVQLALVLSVFILLVACFNFINMATARSSLRAKEVGVRKALGASRQQLIQQFLAEAVMIVSISTVFALVLVEILLPWLNGFTGKSIELIFSWSESISLLLMILLVGLSAGAYPAIFISSFSTLRVLSGDFNRGKSSILFRKLLVCLQSGIAVVLIILTITVYQQINFLKNLELGYEREQVLVMPEIKNSELIRGFDTFENQLKNIPGVVSVTSGEQLPTMKFNFITSVNLPHNGETLDTVPMVGVNYHYLSTLGLELMTGRDFSREYPGDYYQMNKASDSGSAGVIINESAMKMAGWKTPAEALGQQWNWDRGTTNNGTVVGVVKDLRFVSAHEPIQPISFILGYFLQGRDTLAIKYDSADHFLVKSQVDQLFGKVFAMPRVDSTLLTANFDELYVKEDKQTSLLLNFTGLIIIITCIGLFGLASFTAERRRKEVALRKILGASTSNLVLTLTSEFSKLVLIANILAWPIAYLSTSYWLEGFSVRIDVQWWLFLLASLLTLSISWLTVAGLSYKAASSRPVSSLRCE